ncbi:MAG: hypothetical protein R2724_01425 [Bryobacterales bacterium]
MTAWAAKGFERLVRAFYEQVPGDDILGPMYPAEDLPGAEERLRDFLMFRFGGPPKYIMERGHRGCGCGMGAFRSGRRRGIAG